jgi:hypothetical protein
MIFGVDDRHERRIAKSTIAIARCLAIRFAIDHDDRLGRDVLRRVRFGARSPAHE